jgi:hypothetical protein
MLLRQEDDNEPRQFLPPLKYPDGVIESPANSWNEEEEEYQPMTPPTPPVKDTRPLADIDFQEKVPDQTYAGVEGITPPKVTKRKKVVPKKADAVKVEDAEDAEDAKDAKDA